MARAGDVIEHPVSGETIVFLQTGEDTGGDLLQIDLFARPEGAGARTQLHPQQEKRFVVKRGWMMLRVHGKLRVLGSGEEAIVPAGTSHLWWNCGFDELNALVEMRPAGRYDQLVSTLFALAKAGQVDETGDPGALQMAVTLDEYRDTLRLVDYRSRVWRAVLPTVALIGRALGMKPSYPYPRSARVNGGLEIWRTETFGRSPATIG
jgi:mannose-6-phosphate isomerase-like protein (cupin superfamily)